MTVGSLSNMAELHRPEVRDKPKKRPKLGRKKDLLKEQRLRNHRAGESCNCTRLKCFETTTPEARESVLDHFNGLKTKDEQDAFLSTLISVNRIKRRRTRVERKEASHLHEHSYKYYLNCLQEGGLQPVEICLKALLSIFDIKKGRVERIRQSLAATGLPPKDKRGQHKNRPHAFTEDDTQHIIDHITSFHGRKSHKKSTRLYLPNELNISKMYQMFKDKNPLSKCSYESYRSVFNTKFNISFGYPKKDTCSTCDRLQCQLDDLNKVIAGAASSSAEAAACAATETERGKIVPNYSEVGLWVDMAMGNLS